MIALSRRPDGGERSPMRATEARLTLAVTALRGGDLEAAAAWTRAALDQPRRSVAPLSMIASEVAQEVQRRYPGEPAAAAVVEPINAEVWRR